MVSGNYVKDITLSRYKVIQHENTLLSFILQVYLCRRVHSLSVLILDSGYSRRMGLADDPTDFEALYPVVLVSKVCDLI